jgi:ubiquinone/menaquinone biosynthesis C-methylase UbiE
MAKDLFSEQSKLYAQFRPTYPKELFDYILQFVEERKTAWDCATGNGQAATALAEYFEKVEASDISEAQISNAVKRENIEYHICSAETTPFRDNNFDLITVAQAYHWLNWKEFYIEAIRVGKPNAVVAIWTYNTLFSNDEKLNAIIRHFYLDITGLYWDKERKYVDE